VFGFVPLGIWFHWITFFRKTRNKSKAKQKSSLGLKYFVCVVICSACQDIHGHQSQPGEIIKYINVCV